MGGLSARYGSNRQKRCPKSSATSIGLRSRTLATIAERISHSHPALTLAGASRIEHHCGTCGDRDATDFFCSALPAHMSRPIPHRSFQFSRPPFFCHSFSRAQLRANSCVLQLRASSAFPVPPLRQWVPSDKAAARFWKQKPLASGCPKKMGQEKGENSAMSYLTLQLSSGSLVLTRSNVKRKATVRNSPCCRSPHGALGRTQMTNGVRKPTGIGSLFSGHFWQSVSLRLSRRVTTYGELII